MKHYTADELTTVLAEHKKWLADKGGSRADLSGAYLIGADLSRANLGGAYLSGADLRGADLRGANLGGAYLSGAYLRGAYLSRADLIGADLSGADLIGADLSEADLRGADLSRADLRGADLSGADLSGADLSGADLIGADLSEADLSGADLSGVKIQSCAVFTGLYKYLAMPVIAEDGTEYIRLGCHFRKASEWSGNFWNNPSEFPNNGDAGSKDRWNAYQACLRWLEDHREASVPAVEVAAAEGS
jgi:hypothetical protein